MLPEPSLLSLQRDFMRALREPVFGESRAATALGRRTGETSSYFARTADAHISPSATLAPVERLELYHRQYWYRLLDSLAEDFPALQRLLGERRFWRLAESYLEATSSRSFTLRHLGDKLANFLESNPRLAGPQPVHAIELARLEYALCEAFEAAELPLVPADQVSELPLRLQPHLKLLALRTTADQFWRHDDPDRQPRKLTLKASAEPSILVAVFRLQFQLRVERLEPTAFQLLSAIAATGSLDDAFALARISDDAHTLDQVREWFQLWTSRGWLCSPAAEPVVVNHRGVGQAFQPAGSPDFPVRCSQRATRKSPMGAKTPASPNFVAYATKFCTVENTGS
jgi:hypothetical protein